MGAHSVVLIQKSINEMGFCPKADNDSMELYIKIWRLLLRLAEQGKIAPLAFNDLNVGITLISSWRD